MSNEQLNNLTRPRVVRVFISSTFSDMQEEREELVKRIFPQIRKLCEERGVTFVDVDLRWGVTDEQKAEGKVLPICLKEIDNCRPFFIGILGERYGWIPEKIPDEVIAQQPWLADHKTSSVTELEIMHGVLKNPKMSSRAYFYLRNPMYITRLPSEKKSAFEENTPARRVKLTKLKDRIRQSGLVVRENYHDPKDLGQLVLKDLTDAINQEFPSGTELSPLDREAAEHEMFARSRAVVEVNPGEFSGVYIARKEYFDKLDEHAKGDGPPLVITGESGCGKSALLANWALKYRATHPDELLIMHFIGASSYSSDWAAMLRRFLGEFQRHFNIQQKIPDNLHELRVAFANWLHMVAVKGRVILIIDGLNQLEDKEQALDLVWLPPVIPPNIRLVVSALPGRPLDNLKKRYWQDLPVEQIDLAERKRLIKEYLSQYRKTLSYQQTDRIAVSEQAGNPLFLRTLLEELRLFGSYEQLDERIEHYLKSHSVVGLFERILIRYEQDYERERPGLIADAMRLLWAARRGLSETELLDLLGTNGEPLPRAYWSDFYLAAEQSFVSRSGLINFFHDYFRTAVHNRYLPREQAQKSVHLQLADYFEKRVINRRKVDELPWQLAEAQSWRRLYDLLADLSFFNIAWQLNPFEIKIYWAKLNNDSSFRMLDGYRNVLREPMNYVESVSTVAILLADSGYLHEALSLHKFLSKYYCETEDREKLAISLGNQGVILGRQYDYDTAMAMHKKEENIYRELNNMNGLQRTLGNQAAILHSKNEFQKAMTLYQEQSKICEELGNKEGLALSIGNQAMIFDASHEFEKSLSMFKKAEMIYRESGNWDGLLRMLGNQAHISIFYGDLNKANNLYKENELICRKIGHREELAISLHNQAMISYWTGNINKSLALFTDEERIHRELDDMDRLANCLIKQAIIWMDHLGNSPKAIINGEQVLEICKKLKNFNGICNAQILLFRARWGLPSHSMQIMFLCFPFILIPLCSYLGMYNSSLQFISLPVTFLSVLVFVITTIISFFPVDRYPNAVLFMVRTILLIPLVLLVFIVALCCFPMRMQFRLEYAARQSYGIGSD